MVKSTIVLGGVVLIVFLATTALNISIISSLREELSAMQSQVAVLSSENAELKSSLLRLNETIRLLTESFRKEAVKLEGLFLKMDAKDMVSRGETVQVNLTLTNLGAQPVTLTFPSSKIFDVKVVDSSGRVVYRWSQDKVFLTVIVQLVLKPGESRNETLTWKCELPEGDYILTGIVEAYNATLVFSKPLKVVH
jgi:hypothetical protein